MVFLVTSRWGNSFSYYSALTFAETEKGDPKHKYCGEGHKRNIKTIVMKNSPSCLAIGRVTLDDDFDFWWPNRGLPWLWDDEGLWVPFKLDGHVPLLRSDAQPVVPP